MGIFNGFICDCCKKSFKSNEENYQPVAIGLTVSFGQTHIGNYPRKQVWCRKCVMKYGISKPCCDDDIEIAPNNELSFEEKLATLIQDMGFLRE